MSVTSKRRRRQRRRLARIGLCWAPPPALRDVYDGVTGELIARQVPCSGYYFGLFKIDKE